MDPKWYQLQTLLASPAIRRCENPRLQGGWIARRSHRYDARQGMHFCNVLGIFRVFLIFLVQQKACVTQRWAARRSGQKNISNSSRREMVKSGCSLGTISEDLFPKEKRWPFLECASFKHGQIWLVVQFIREFEPACILCIRLSAEYMIFLLLKTLTLWRQMLMQ